MRKERKVWQKIFFWSVFLLSIFLVAIGIWFYRHLKSTLFWTLDRVNLVVFSNNPPWVGLVSLSEKSGLVLVLPAGEKVTVTRGYGQYELGKVFPLGEIEGKGGQLLKETLQENFSLPVFGFFFDSDLNTEDLRNKSLLQNLFWRGIREKNQTNLSFFDLLVLYFRSGRVTNFSFEEYSEDKLKGYFQDPIIREETLPAAFLNGTDHNGLAQKISLLWENLGGRVVMVADDSEKGQEKCKIVYRGKARDSYSFWLMKKIFDCQEEESREGEEGRIDLTLVIGEDYWKKLSEKW